MTAMSRISIEPESNCLNVVQFTLWKWCNNEERAFRKASCIRLLLQLKVSIPLLSRLTVRLQRRISPYNLHINLTNQIIIIRQRIKGIE